jgi:hypothetical protein
MTFLMGGYSFTIHNMCYRTYKQGLLFAHTAHILYEISLGRSWSLGAAPHMLSIQRCSVRFPFGPKKL